MIEIHTSDRSVFKSCRQRWDWSSPLRGNFEPIRGQVPLEFGSAIHAGLAEYYTPREAKSSREYAALEAFQSYMDSWWSAIEETADEETEIEWNENVNLGIGMLYHYFEWAPEQDKDLKVVWVEREYRVPIGFIQDNVFHAERSPTNQFRAELVYLSFKPDGLAVDAYGRYWIMEHKTAKRIEDNIDYLLLDDQCGSYMLGLWLAEEIEVEGIIYTTHRKKVPPPIKTLSTGGLSLDKRQDVTYERAVKQIKEDHGGRVPERYQDFLAHLTAKGNTYFQRIPVRRNRAEIEIMYESLMMETRDILSNPAIYRNPSRFNCNSCAFVAPCIAKHEGGDFETILQGEFQKRKGAKSGAG